MPTKEQIKGYNAHPSLQDPSGSFLIEPIKKICKELCIEEVRPGVIEKLAHEAVSHGTTYEKQMAYAKEQIYQGFMERYKASEIPSSQELKPSVKKSDKPERSC
jgi:hypothetical protein